MTAASATGATIYYTTNAAGTEFVPSDSLVLASVSGASATLTFTPNGPSLFSAPPGTEVDLGNFTLVCSACSALASAHFNAFTFDIILTECANAGCTGSPVAIGEWVGTAAAGNVFSDNTSLVINFTPMQLGTGTNNATSGNFGVTDFIIADSGIVDIVAPNSGSTPGETTVQALVDSADPTTPEPATLSLIGGGLLSLGLLRRKAARRSRL
jgi:hypothetical protein